MIKVSFSPECIQLLRDLGIPQDRARVTINERHQGLVNDGVDRVIASHWFADDDIVLVESLVTDKEVDREHNQTRIISVKATLVLLLQSRLPAGRITRKTQMEDLLGVVAESFGHPVTCYPGNPPTYLYAGPWDKEGVRLHGGNEGSTLVTGSFYPDENRCELVWAFSSDRYRKWVDGSASAGPVRRGVIPSRSALEPLVDTIKAYVENFSHNYPDISPTSEAVQFGLAMKVLNQSLGDDWVQRNLFDARSLHPLRVANVTGTAGMKAQARAAELGEMIFNLQAVPGFQARLETLKTNDLTSTVAELHAAKLLALSELPFSFVEPSGTKGLDYEAKIALPSGHIGSCEVKTKREDTPLTSRTILNSLKEAGSQTPKDAPLIIFLKIPDHWYVDPRLKTFAESATQKFFRHYNRAIAVVFFWEEWPVLTNGTLLHFWKHKEIINKESRFYDEQNTFLLRSIVTQPTVKSWVYFAELFRKWSGSSGQG